MLNPEPDYVINGAWMPNIVFDKKLGINRDLLLKTFQSENIDARVFFWPLSSLAMFETVKTNENSWDISNRSINLPSFHDLHNQQIDRITSLIIELLDECK